MSNTSDHCKSCGVPWADHNGVQVICAELRHAREKLEQLTHERDMYRKLFESALSNVDRVFQLCQENPEPILPDFAILGEDKFRAVVRLAEEYKRMQSKLAAVRAKLQKVVITEGVDSGVVLLSSEGTTHSEIRDGKPCQVYDHVHCSALGDALVELWEIVQ